jgi:two-component system sensor histidine kinase KdpD
MTPRRPDPDELLLRVREEENQANRGKLTIFFGAAPGVGKTYTMLEAARIEVEQGRDTVVGVVETHGRYDTGALVIGLEIVPRHQTEHRGIQLTELDLDACLARKPSLLLVDELAHTNVPGSRHPKRWQDVDELLFAGIDVFTTLNVQHVESLNDVVAQITGVIVRETVPDSVLDRAYEVRLVDLPIGELLERLREGKVYMPEQAERAVANFFKEGNLIALRELALRRTAERVDAQMRGYKLAHGIEATWHAGERVLVCVSASPTSARLVRAARRMAQSLHAELIGLNVETPGALRMSQGERARLTSHMRLLTQLGGESVTVRGEDAAAETVRFARQRNVTKIVLGKPLGSRWDRFRSRSFLNQVVSLSGEIDVYVISGTAFEERLSASARREAPAAAEGLRAGQYAAGLGTVVAATLVARFFGPSELPDVAMIFLLGVVVASMRFGYGPALVATVASVVSFDFFFVPPLYSFAVSDLRHITTFAVMFVVSFVISHLTKRIREQADGAREAEQRTASLYAVTRELSVAQGRGVLLAVAARHVREVFRGAVAVLMPQDDGSLEPVLADPGVFLGSDKDLGVAGWVWTHQRAAGFGTDTLPSAPATFFPLKGARGRVGVLALLRHDRASEAPHDRELLETFAGLIGSALERVVLAEEARRAQLRVESEQLRNSLLSSVSHDLRTPLAIVTGAASTLLDPAGPTDVAIRRDLIETIHSEGQRLNRLVQNLLDMTRLEAGVLEIHKEWQPIEEVVGAALERTESRLLGRQVTTELAPNLPLASFDSVLIEQVLINLLENAARHTPPGTEVLLAARARPDELEIEVSDRGPGVSPADAAHVFEKFYRAGAGGVGLGLTICQGIVLAHGGRIWVEAREGGGASFRFTLPVTGQPPALEEAPMPSGEPTSPAGA